MINQSHGAPHARPEHSAATPKLLTDAPARAGMVAFPVPFLAAFLVALLMASLLAGCKATRPDNGTSPGHLTITGDVVPIILKADTSSTATVWVTVMEDGGPVADSTIVNLVATLGTVPSQVYTLDGLAVASYTAVQEQGVATIVAQSLGARDTMTVTLY